MPPETLKLLLDMRQAAEEIANSTSGRTIDDYLADNQLRRAVERCFEIIGEALSQLHKIDPAVAEQFTDWRSIISFRHVLIYGYGVIDHR